MGGSAICRSDGSIGGYNIVDASLGGVRLNQGTPLPAGTELEMALWWAGIGLATLRGTVVRSEHCSMAVAFADLGPEARELLAELVRIERHGARATASLIFCSSASCMEMVRDLLGAMGQRSFAVETPLDGIVALQREWLDVREVFAEDSAIGREFLAFVREEFPQVTRVLLTSPERGAHTFVDPGLADRVVHLWVSGADRPALRKLGIGSDEPLEFAEGTVRHRRIPRSVLFGCEEKS